MENKLPDIPSPWRRHVKGAVLVLMAALLLAGALTIPFIFESPSIQYKFGFDKTFLRTGKLLGMSAATLILFQLLLAARLKFLDRIFSLPRIFKFHRTNGFIIAVLVLLHPVFIFLPEDITSTPLKLEYWPEAAGVILLMLICLQVALSQWRKSVNISFDRWRSYHRYTGGFIIGLLVLHVLYTSESFKEGLPRYGVIMAALFFISIFLAGKIKPTVERKHIYGINRVTKEGRKVVTLNVASEKSASFSYLPGQFAFISISSDLMPKEAHPFTISSTPTRPDGLSFTIKDCGDWTSQIKHLQKGTSVRINGPFGLFTHLTCPARQPIIMIAGGIGITPMISMLGYMYDMKDKRNILLIWSNKTQKDLVCQKEMDRIQRKLTDLTIVHIFTQEKAAGCASGRLTRKRLQHLLETSDRASAVFICGPPLMMNQVAHDIKSLGFNRRAIHTEAFHL